MVQRYKVSIFAKQKYKVVYVKPLKEADCEDTMFWKLNTTIYRLNDASRSWCLNVKKC